MDAYAPLVDDAIELSDGRRLRYAVWGDPDGRPVFFFHGAPGSRVFAPNPEGTLAAGVRLITLDRPGYGGSDSLSGREILDWPRDVAELANALGVPQFDVAAHSSGGPYALACALKLPDRVRRVTLVSCVAPQDDLHPDGITGEDDDAALTRQAREDPEQAAVGIAGSVAWLVETPDRFLDLPRPEPDALLLQDERVRATFLATIREAVRQGVDAYAWDVVLERRPWGFALSDVRAQVSIYQGDSDRSVPPIEAEVLARGLPNASLTLVAGAGHGLVLANWAEILSASGEQGPPKSSG